MTYLIYGLRVRGDIECRYVGLTGHSPETRLLKLTNDAKRRRIPNPNGSLGEWLQLNEGNIETFVLDSADTKAEAHANERRAAAFCIALNHRLLNCWLVPADRRIGWARAGYGFAGAYIRKAGVARRAAEVSLNHGGGQ